MLTKERIEAKGRALLSAGDAPLFVGGFIEGATWANAKNAQEIAELKDNIRNLNITIENAAEWSEKQAAEIAELVDALRKAHFRLEKGFEYSDPDFVAILAKYEK